MKKTYNINLNNQIFYIDEDAYIQLQNYIETLEHHYFAEEDGREIMLDIESRIAELFRELLQKAHKEVVTQAEIDQVIGIMGTPDVIIDEDTEGHASQANNTRKLYRNPDKAILGGVAAGVASYFSFPVHWVRLIFILCGFFYGVAIIVYIILWIVLPKAVTAKQKLEMKGKKINVSNIEQNIRDTYNEVKTDSGIKSFTNYIGRKLDAFFLVCKKIIGKIFSLCFYILSIGGLLAGIVFLVLACWSIFFSYHFAPENYYTFFSYACAPVPMWLIKLIALLIVSIPIFLITYYSIRYLFKFQGRKGVFLIFAGIWLLSCMAGVIVCVYQARNYTQEYQNKEVVSLIPGNPAGKSFHVIFDSPENLQYQSILKGELDRYILHSPEKNEGDSAILYLKPEISFGRTDQACPELIILKEARGFSGAEAAKNTHKMQLRYEWKGDTLRLDDYYKLNGTQWRVNDMQIEILIPENYKITLSNPPRNNVYNHTAFKNPKKFYHNTPAVQTYVMKEGTLAEIN